jgi:flagellar basal body-associated protein FliL
VEVFDRIISLGPLLIPIVVVIVVVMVGGVIAIVGMMHRHQERLAKIERGIDPDAPWPQPRLRQ